jgi:plasmid stabilization system protein ParE
VRYILHRAVEHELGKVVRFYRVEAGRAVAIRFLDEFERVAELLVENPDLGSPTHDERRWFPLRGFPYLIIYRPRAEGIRILVLRHQSRDPEYGEERR